MYKLMIVEDEPLIRTGLKHYFAWEKLGVHSIIEAENGREGMTTALREARFGDHRYPDARNGWASND